MSFSDVLRFSQLDLRARRVFLRADLDAPLVGGGRLGNDACVERLLPALEVLIATRSKIVIAGHSRKRDASMPSAVADRLSALLDRPIVRLERDFPSQVGSLAEGQIALAPNLALYPEELSNDASWAMRIARAVDVYVSEAPIAARQTRASTVALPLLLPARGAGLELGNDLDMTRDFVELPASPYTAVIGGSGVVRKASFLRGLVGRVDTLLLGGVVANTFLVASGWQPRSSWYEEEALEIAKDILAAARLRGVRVLLPTDAVTLSRRAGAKGEFEERELTALAPDEAFLDIGEETRRAYREVLVQSATVLWNGQMGQGASEQTLGGTRAVVQAAVETAAYSGVVGERSVALAMSLGLTPRFRWVSSGGDGAFELLAGLASPGIESLRQRTESRPIPAALLANH